MEAVKSSSYSKDKSSSKHKSSKESSSKSKKASKHRHHRDDPSSSEENGSKRKYEHSEDEVNSDSDIDRNKNHHKRSQKDDRSSRKHRTDEKSNKNEESTNGKSDSGGGGGGDISLSIEETNKLREKLGLKPLTDHKTANDNKKTVDGKKTYIDQDTNQEFEHVPAKNLADIRDQKEIRQKLQEQKEKRLLVEKLRNAKGLADSDEEDNSAASWLIKIKQKEDAQKKAKLLQEMDEQFEEEAAVVTNKPVKKETRPKKYDENDLTGLRVEHDQSFFKEGQEIILTLKDRNILKGTGDNADVDDDEEADVLVNVNIMDDERANKNIENKKKKPDYRAYDEFDEDGMYKEKSILDKYNEELNGETKKSFKLGSHGTYDASDDKFIERLNQEHKARAIKIDALNELKLATDYMTPQEMEKFKKPKKVRKVLRKNKMMKADDLLATAPEPTAPKPKKVKQEDEFLDSIVKKEPEDEANRAAKSNKISLKDIDFGFSKNKSDDEDGEYNEEEEEDEDDDIDVNKLKHNEIQEMKQILEDENNALDELHSVLSKTRKRVTSSILRSNQIKEEIAENVYETKTNGVAFENLNTVVEYTEEDRALTLDSLSEFCRNLGHTSSSTRTEKIEEEEDDEEEVKMEMEKSHEKDESSDEEDVTTTAKEMVVEGEDEEEGFDLLDEEPVIDRGLASCLQLAVNKGYIDVEKSKQNARFNKASIEAVNYTVEEKNYYDIDDKYNRNRDRFSGPLSDFQEKSNYKPDVKLDYIDEKGHAMNEKEAFRYLSHRFHGKGSGKKKTEKQNKKIKEMEAMNKMSSVDTPLNTVALLVEKQKKLQQPFVVLSTSKNKQDQVTLHKR